MAAVNEFATVDGLRRALQIMTHLQEGQDTLDLVILSACQSATPAILEAVAPYARYLLASPADLHLSHMDTDALGLLKSRPEISALELADSIASTAFRRLFLRTRTELPIARFNLVAVRREGFIQAGGSESPDSYGMRLWHRPSQFGKKGKTVQRGDPGGDVRR